MNEVLFFTSALLDLSFILLLYRFGKGGLFASIVVNIILVSTFGAKIITLFGFTTNAGNVFYAAIFLATNILTEHHGKKSAYQSVMIGFSSLILFIIMSQFVLRFSTVQNTVDIDTAMQTLFRAVPRLAFASIFSYLIVQNFNVWFFDYLHQKSGEKLLWVRNIVSTIFAQFIDSIIFFSIAFLGILPINILAQTAIIGFLAKSIIAVLSTPFLYLSYFLKGSNKNNFIE